MYPKEDTRVKITCPICDKLIKLPKYIDTEYYDGEVVCQECKSLLHIKMIKSKVQKYKITEPELKKQ